MGLPHCRQTVYHLSQQGSPSLARLVSKQKAVAGKWEARDSLFALNPTAEKGGKVGCMGTAPLVRVGWTPRPAYRFWSLVFPTPNLDLSVRLCNRDKRKSQLSHSSIVREKYCQWQERRSKCRAGAGLEEKGGGRRGGWGGHRPALPYSCYCFTGRDRGKSHTPPKVPLTEQLSTGRCGPSWVPEKLLLTSGWNQA